jgi:hypothetical protein
MRPWPRRPPWSRWTATGPRWRGVPSSRCLVATPVPRRPGGDPGPECRAHGARDLRGPGPGDRGHEPRGPLLHLRHPRERELLALGGALDGLGPGLRGPEVAGVLDSVVVVMDPVANPDGYDRYVNHWRSTRMARPTPPRAPGAAGALARGASQPLPLRPEPGLGLAHPAGVPGPAERYLPGTPRSTWTSTRWASSRRTSSSRRPPPSTPSTPSTSSSGGGASARGTPGPWTGRGSSTTRRRTSTSSTRGTGTPGPRSWAPSG